MFGDNLTILCIEYQADLNRLRALGHAVQVQVGRHTSCYFNGTMERMHQILMFTPYGNVGQLAVLWISWDITVQPLKGSSPSIKDNFWYSKLTKTVSFMNLLDCKLFLNCYFFLLCQSHPLVRISFSFLKCVTRWNIQLTLLIKLARVHISMRPAAEIMRKCWQSE